MSGTFPAGLGSAFDRLSNFTKQIDIVYPDRKDAVIHQSRIRVKLNANSLVNLRSLKMYYQFTTPQAGLAVGGTQIGRYHPRYSSSIIQDIAMYFNNNLISSINEYNLLYNTLGDLTMGNNQKAKRYLENLDPSVKFLGEANIGNNDEVITLIYPTRQSVAGTDNSDTNRQFVINNFINFLGNASTEYLNTNITGDFELAITLAPATIVWQAYIHPTAGNAAHLAAPAVPTYTLNNIYFTYERVILNDPLYDNLISSQVNSPEGLKICFTEYSTHIGPLQTRDINYSFNTSASSLDNIICTTRRADYQTVGPLLTTGGGIAAGNPYELDLITTGNNSFNQSTYFRRDLLSLGTSQIEINGTQMYKRPLTKFEIYQETLNAISPSDDIVSNVHPGLNSINSFLKYYFAHILSLNYNGETKVPTISGLDGRGSNFSILWKVSNSETIPAIVAGAGYSQVYPVVFCAKSQVLQINAGQQHAIMI